MLKYIGKGFITGIPARDLTDEEVKGFGGERKLVDTGLYARPRPVTEIKTEKSKEGDK